MNTGNVSIEHNVEVEKIYNEDLQIPFENTNELDTSRKTDKGKKKKTSELMLKKRTKNRYVMVIFFSFFFFGSTRIE